MRFALKKGIFVIILIVLATVLNPSIVNADEGANSNVKIVKVKDFGDNSYIGMVFDVETNLIVNLPDNYIVITPDEKIYTIDNSDKKLNHVVSFPKDSCYDIYLWESKGELGDNSFKIVNTDGTDTKFPYLDEFHQAVGFVKYLTDETYYYVDSSNVLHIVSSDGQDILNYDLGYKLNYNPIEGLYNRVSKFGNYYVVGLNYYAIIDENGNNVTPDINTFATDGKQYWVSTIEVKQNYICINAYPEYENTYTPTRFYFDKSLKQATEDDYINDVIPSQGQSHYNGQIINESSEIARAVPEGFEYNGEIMLYGETLGLARDLGTALHTYIIYDLNGNVLVSSKTIIGFTGSYFLVLNSDYNIELCKVEKVEPQESEITEDAMIEGFSEDAKVVDADGNPVELDQVAIQAVQARIEVVEQAKAALEEKGVVIPTNAHVTVWDIDLTDPDGNVVRLADGSVNFYMPAERGIDGTGYTAKVYHVLPDGSCEEVKSEWVQLEDGTFRLQVTATSFSPYVVVYSEKAADTPATPGTGDSSNIMMPIVFSAAAVAVLGVVVAKKKQFD